MKGFNVLALVDFFTLNNDNFLMQSILNFIVKDAVYKNIELTACLAKKNSENSKFFKKNIFLDTRMTFSLIAYGLDKLNREKLFNDWNVSWSDHDVI